MLQENTKAPSFILPGDDGKMHKLKDFKGKWILLYFYPKDDTPGCTKEACGLRDYWNVFAKNNITAVGMSADSVESHQKFKVKYELPFLLLSDQKKDILKAYEAWGEKSMFGKKYFGIKRVTYVINPDGVIAKVYEKVSPAKYAKTVLKDWRELQKNLGV